jgi:hypothetical protein
VTLLILAAGVYVGALTFAVSVCRSAGRYIPNRRRKP